MQDNPFLQNTKEVDVVEEKNPFAGNKDTGVENNIKQIEDRSVEEVKTTEVARIPNKEVKAYTSDTPVSYKNVITFETDIKLNIVEKFKLSKDQKAVVAFVLFDEKFGSPQIQMTHTYYDETTKTLFRAPNTQHLLLKVAAKMGEPKIRFATVVLRYLTDNQGRLVKPGEGQKPYDLLAYVFSTDKFPQFKEIHKRWDLKKYDLLLTCSDEKYQKISIIPDQECRYRKDAKWAQAITTEARDMFEKGLNRFLGRELKDEEILAIIEDAPDSTAVTGGESYNPFTSPAADQVGNSGGNEDFSNLVQSPGDVKAEGGSPF